MKDHLNIHCVNPLYLVFNKADGYIEGINENKYFLLLQIKPKKY